MDLGKKRKTVELTLGKKIGYGIMFLLSLIFGLFLGVLALIHNEKKGAQTVMWIGFAIAASSLIYLFSYFKEKKFAGKYTFYENGFVNEITNEETKYDDVTNYYSSMFKLAKQDISYLVVEAKNRTTVFNSLLANGFKLFLKDYIPYSTPKVIENIKNGNTKEFGIMSKADLLKAKFKMTEKSLMDNLKNVVITKKIIVSNQGLTIRDNTNDGASQNYSWNEIKEGKITKLKTFIIKNNEDKKIFETPVMFVQSVDILENVINEFAKK